MVMSRWSVNLTMQCTLFLGKLRLLALLVNQQRENSNDHRKNFMTNRSGLGLNTCTDPGSAIRRAAEPDTDSLSLGKCTKDNKVKTTFYLQIIFIYFKVRTSLVINTFEEYPTLLLIPHYHQTLAIYIGMY